MTLNGNSDETNGYNSVAKNGVTSNVNFIKSMVCPIGSVVSWLKTFTNTPALPDGWVECDGSTLSDSDSPYDGQVIPDLNGGIFLEGQATSGATGGAATMAHTHTGASHTHTLTNAYAKVDLNATTNEIQTGYNASTFSTNRTGTGMSIVAEADTSSASTGLGGNTDATASSTSSAASNTENRPPFYTVVFIMRVK